MSDHTLTGRVVGGAYRITGFQRAGRMGDIYVGRRIDNNEVVSVKMMDPGLFGETEAMKRFERETKITTKLNHPCSLVVLDYGRTEDGLPYMVTEFVEGDVLSEVVEESGRLPAKRAAYLAAQIAMALEAAHAIGVVHRDLAPKNILITNAEDQADSVKVIEFGLSRMTEGDGEGEASTLTAVGVRIGTPFYMAPEYIEEYALDHRADLYSLGIVLFEMLTGSPPFTGRPYKVMDKHITETAPPPSSVSPDVEPWLDTLVADLLVKEPDKRIQTGGEVVARIEAGLGERLATVSAPNVATPVQEQRTGAPSSSDPLIDEFVKVQVDSFASFGGVVEPKKALVVNRVARGSIGERAGVRPGWLCFLPDEKQTGLLEPSLWMRPVAERRYVFATRDGSQGVDLRCSGADIGVEFLRSVENIQASFDPANPSADALLEVWQQQDWPALESLSHRVLTHQKGAMGVLNTGLFARFLGRAGAGKDAGAIKFREHPALMFYGAALVEQGRVHSGMELVREYTLDYGHRFEERFNGVAGFYEAVEQEELGDHARAVDGLVQSWLMWPNERFETRIHKLTGKYPDNRSWYGRQIPDYTLDAASQRGRTVNLYNSLMRLQDHQVWLMIMMGGDRANAEYERVMRRFLAYTNHFGEFIVGCHMVTDTTDRDPSQAPWLAAEDEVISSGRRFEVLEDYRGFLRRAIKPSKVPTVYGINRQGLVVHEGALGSIDLWNMLHDLMRLRRRG